MIETGNLSNFNIARKRDLSECEDVEIVRVVQNNLSSFNSINLLLTETTRFYTENFYELQQVIKREKRLVVFETPSRVLMTHEYTVEGVDRLKNGFYFLFNATERLSWLKITLEEHRVSIASKDKIRFYLKQKLDAEIKNMAEILNKEENEIVNRLYEASDGKPCFIEFNQKENKGQQSLLISVTFFDSIRNKKRLGCARLWSPLQEKLLNYNYSTLSESASSWIYFKAPANFVLSADYGSSNNNNIEVSPSNDDEITSLVLKPNGAKLSVDFKISINVPTALKWWYNGILYIAVLVLFFCLVVLCYSIFGQISKDITDTLNNCVFAIVGALIATRGWLMSEEQVMKKMSNVYTILVCSFIVLVMAISFTAKVIAPKNNDRPNKNFKNYSILKEKFNYIIYDSIWNDNIDKPYWWTDKSNDNLNK